MKTTILGMMMGIAALFQAKALAAVTIRADWNPAQWEHVVTHASGYVARLGFQLKLWKGEDYGSHPSNMVTATPVYFDVWNSLAADRVEFQLEICTGDFDSSYAHTYRVFCYPSKIITLDQDDTSSNHKWAEIDSDSFNVSTASFVKDIFLTRIQCGRPDVHSCDYLEAWQFIRVWVNGQKVIDERISMLDAMKK